jgi:ubiquinone/menaquinone biosynthesis C-methylase UbiE
MGHKKRRMRMGVKSAVSLFDAIAPVYGLFYGWQRRGYARIAEKAGEELNFPPGAKVLDVGCGTGALCAVLAGRGFSVTGVDPAEKMLAVARRKHPNKGVRFVCADVTSGLPFAGKSFDLAIASYVAHGLSPDARRQLYTEMSRLARKKVIIHDYNQNRSVLTSFVEWLEQGDYFHFIRVAEDEMKNSVSQMRECFSDVRVVQVGPRAAWYIATPR